jgi:hypothetical protein
MRNYDAERVDLRAAADGLGRSSPDSNSTPTEEAAMTAVETSTTVPLEFDIVH